MLRRLLLIGIFVLLFALPAPSHAAKSYYAERFDVDMQLGEGGVLEVTETVVFHFEGGPFTFVFRELEADYSDGITDIVAHLNGLPLPSGDDAGEVEIEGRDPIKVTWHFAPLSDAVSTFTLSYRVLGVVRQDADADRFVWNVLPTEYEYTIQSSTVRLGYPASLAPAGPVEIQRGRAEITQGSGEIVFTGSELRSDTPLTVAVPFPSGSLIAAPPEWQERQQTARESLPGFAAGALALLGVGSAGLAALWRRGRRDQDTLTTPASSSAVLPSNLAPAAAAALKAGGTVSAAHATGAMFGLAQRGVLTIEETADKRWYRSRQFAVHLANPRADLRPHEEGLLDLMFSEKQGPADTVKFSDLSSRLSTRLSRFSKPLTEELVQAGLLDPARQAMSRRFMFLGIGLLLAMIPVLVVAVLLSSRFGGAPFLLAAAMFVLGLIAFILSATYSPLSEEGAREAARWQGFESYLKDVAKGRETAWDMTLFDRYFPYAAAFGQAEGWAKAYQKRGGSALPDWFHALSASPDDIWPAFIVMTSAAHSSSSAGGGAGAGGAGGGGGSGAG